MNNFLMLIQTVRDWIMEERKAKFRRASEVRT
jgi:hypothetical protein